MQKDFELLVGNLNNRMRIFICLVVMALAAGCATIPKQTVPFPTYSDSTCQAAIKTGAQAISDCSREHILAQMETRPANYTKARESLASALAALQPGKVNPARPEFERIAMCFETALTGVDRIIIGQKEADQTAEAIGWKILDQSAGELILVLEPYAGPTRGRQ
jgi:hypothetical protein